MLKRNLFFWLVITHFIAFSQTGTIRGIIYDEVLEPAMGASVLVKDSQFYAVSDFNGLFVIPNLPYGEYILDISYIGYATQSISVNLSDKNSKTINKVDMGPPITQDVTAAIPATTNKE